MPQNLIATAINKLIPLVGNGLEFGIGIEPNGNLLPVITSFSKDKIEIPLNYLNSITNGGIFIHYHPSGSSLSFQDFKTAHDFNFSGIIAFVTNGYKGKGIYVINNPRRVNISKIKYLFIKFHSHEVNILNKKCSKNVKLNYSREYKKVNRKVWLKIAKITKLEYYWIGF